MRLYGAISKVEPQDDGTVRVHGIATTEAVDDQGEIVRAAAMRAAIPDYMKFPALREMHQLSAAGTTLEAECDDDGITRIVAHVVDPVAVSKVKNLVYRGFSIGGRVTQREAGAPKNITGLVLNEISLVDRPANPEAIFDCWKAAAAMTTQSQAFNPPVQIWACGTIDHRHLTKADAIKCLEKRAAAGVGDLQAAVDAGLEAVANSLPLARTGGEQVATDPAILTAAAPMVDDRAAHEMRKAETQTALTAAREALAAAGAVLDKAVPLVLGKDGDEGGDDMAEAAKSPPQAKAGDGDKPYGDVEYADPGYQSDGKKRYPLDSEKHVHAAWSYINMPKNAKEYSAEQLAHVKGKIRAAGKKYDIEFEADDKCEMTARAVLTKHLLDIGWVAEIILSLDRLQDMLEMEALMEGDDSPQPARLTAIITELCGFLNALVAEETAEVLNDTEIDPDAPGMGMGPVAMSAIAGSLRKTIADTAKLETLMTQLEKAGARHNKVDQAHLDTAAFAIGKAMDCGTAKRSEMASMADAHKAVLDSGATNLGADGREMLTDGNPTQGAGAATQNSTTDTGRNARTTAPNPTGAVPVTPVPAEAQPGMHKAAGADLIAMVEAIAKSGKGHLPLMQCAHDLLHEACDGATCKEGAAKPGRISAGDMAMMHKCHGHLMAVDGIQCAAAADNAAPGGAVATTAAEGETQGTATTSGGAGSDRGAPGKDAASANEDLQKVLADERAEKAALVKTLGEVVPMMAAMQKRIEQIANTPLPAATVAMPAATEAARAAAAAGEGPSTEDIVKALADMPEERRVQTLIKAQFRRPIRISRFENAMTQREIAKQAGQS
jgi:hypothetical protein